MSSSIHDLIAAARSRRKFLHQSPVSREVLLQLVDAARLSPSAGNLQKLRFSVHNTDGECQAIFPLLRWAGYLKEWNGPSVSEMPAAYIVIWRDANMGGANEIDLGIAAQSINLAAVGDHGLACCMIGAFDAQALHTAILPGRDDLSPLLVLALGAPAEQVVVDDMTEQNVRYWRDENLVHHVPKRPLADILV